MREEWIVSFLKTDLGCRSVAAVHNILFREREKLRLDRLQELVVVSTGEIGSSDAELKKGITCNHPIVGIAYEADMSGRVAWCK